MGYAYPILPGTVPVPSAQRGVVLSQLVGVHMVSKAEKRARAQAKLETKAPVAETQTITKADVGTVPAEAKAATTPKVVTKVVGTLKVKPGLTFRGARAAWYQVLVAHDGKPAQEYLEATTKTPPSLPKSGRQEPSSGWFRWFVRHEVATIVQPEAKA